MFCFTSVSTIAVTYIDGIFQETAHEKTQKYKEGKSVLERSVNIWRKRIRILIFSVYFLGSIMAVEFIVFFFFFGAGLRCLVPMVAITGSAMEHILVEVMQMMLDYSFI